MFKVKNERCDQCLFSKNKIVSTKRKNEILRECKANDSNFQCHKATIEGKDVCCNGFYESRSTNLIRIASRLDAIQFVD